MTAKRLSLPSLSGIVCATVALWVSFGTLGLGSTGASAWRVGILPSPWWLLAALAVVALTAIVAGTGRDRLLWLSILTLLPWLPVPMPPAAYVWAGPLGWGVWATIAAAILAPRLIAATRQVQVRLLLDPRRAPYAAALFAAVVYVLAAWQIAPQLPAGDEPHYLVITQSLLRDGDLKIENNHVRGDYHAYFAGQLKPDYLARGTNGEIYSVHAPGLPAVIAPVFALFGYPGVLAFLALVSGSATGLAWYAAWLVTRDAAASWFGWATVSLSVPFFFQAFTVYPDGLGAALVMVGMMIAILADRASSRALLAAGFAAALLPWLHTRFAVMAGALGLVIAARQFGAPDRMRRIAAFAALPVVSALAWFSFFYVIYGSPNPVVVYHGYTQSAIGNVPRSLIGLLFDQQFGLLPHAPVYLCAFAGFVPLARRWPRVAGTLALVVIPYTLATAFYYMWWGGSVSPARFITLILLPLAIPAGAWYAASRPAGRIVGLGALLLSVQITLVTAAVDRGALLYDVRSGAAKIFRWASPLVDLTTGLPSLFQTTPAQALTRATIWLLAVAATAGVATRLDRRKASRGAMALGVGAMAAGTGMIALSMVWGLNAAHPLTPDRSGQRLLQAIDGDAQQVAVRYAPLRRVRARDIPPWLSLLSPLPLPHRPGDPLALIVDPPAAVYTIEAIVTGDAGHLTAGVGRRPPLWDWDLAGVHGPWTGTLMLGNDAAALHVDADPSTLEAISHLTLHAQRRLAAHERVTDRQAFSAARYGPATVFLLDGTAFVELSGAWVAGHSQAEFAIVPDPGHPIRLFVRNAPIDNVVTLESGRWRQELTLKAREERFIDVPIERDRPGAVLRVRTSAGARPSELEPGNRDDRLLGCWIETR